MNIKKYIEQQCEQIKFLKLDALSTYSYI